MQITYRSPSPNMTLSCTLPYSVCMRCEGLQIHLMAWLSSPRLSALANEHSQVISLTFLFARGLGMSLISSGTLRKRTVQRKPSMPPICLLSITSGRWSERRKSTSAANRSPFWWACSLTPRAPTGQHKSTSAAYLLEPWCSPGGQTEKHKSSMPLLCWSSLGHMRTLGRATGQRKSASAANLLRPQRPQESLTVKHKTSMPPICRAFLGQQETPRALTERRKSTSVASPLRPWCPQVVPTERHKPSTPPICWIPPGLSTPPRRATVKTKSINAADLLQSRWSSAPATVRRKSRRAAKLSVGAEGLCFSFWVRCERSKIPYGSSIAPRLVRVAKWKKPHRCAVLYVSQRRGLRSSSVNA